jgi:lipopolysaccharide export system protein LptA
MGLMLGKMNNKLLIIIFVSIFIIASGRLFLVQAESGVEDQFEVMADEMILEEGEIVAKGNVEINSFQGKMTGERFELNNNTESGLLTGSPVLSKDNWRIQGSRFEIDFAAEEIFIPKNAHLRSETMQADAKQLLFVNKKNQVILTGEVVVNNQGKKLTANQVVIDLKTEKLSSTGRTKLTLPDDELDSEAEE